MIWRIALAATMIGIFVYCGVEAIAQSVMNQYTCTVTSVTSASVPTVIMSPGRVTTWAIHVEASPALDNVKIFPYNGTPPTAVPSPDIGMERPSGSDWTDSITCDNSSCRDAMGQGWVGYLQGGSTATKVDVCTR